MTILWTRGQLKDNAKDKLRVFYWQAFLVCLIAMFLGAGTDSFFRVKGKRGSDTGGGTQISISGDNGVGFSYNPNGQAKINTPVYNVSLSADYGIIIIFVMLMIGSMVLAISVFVSNVVQIGKKRYFLKKAAWSGETGIGELFSGFKEGYGNLVLVMFRKGFSVFLWSLLFFIPGIIKSYEYYMVPYLLAENPYLSWEEVRNLSSKIMEGNKFDVFVLELSFIGWDILGALLCGVGQVFVYPYKEMVYAELYSLLNNGSEEAGRYEV